MDPGEHPLCASWEFGAGKGRVIAGIVGAGSGFSAQASAKSFVAEAGGVYYFAVKNVYVRSTDKETISQAKTGLRQLDSDAGQLMAEDFPVSESRRKK